MYSFTRRNIHTGTYPSIREDGAPYETFSSHRKRHKCTYLLCKVFNCCIHALFVVQHQYTNVCIHVMYYVYTITESKRQKSVAYTGDLQTQAESTRLTHRIWNSNKFFYKATVVDITESERKNWNLFINSHLKSLHLHSHSYYGTRAICIRNERRSPFWCVAFGCVGVMHFSAWHLAVHIEGVSRCCSVADIFYRNLFVDEIFIIYKTLLYLLYVKALSSDVIVVYHGPVSFGTLFIKQGVCRFKTGYIL